MHERLGKAAQASLNQASLNQVRLNQSAVQHVTVDPFLSEILHPPLSLSPSIFLPSLAGATTKDACAKKGRWPALPGFFCLFCFVTRNSDGCDGEEGQGPAADPSLEDGRFEGSAGRGVFK